MLLSMNHVTVEMPHDRAWTVDVEMRALVENGCLDLSIKTRVFHHGHDLRDGNCNIDVYTPHVCLSSDLCENKVEDKSYIS